MHLVMPPTSVQPSEKKPVTMNGGVKPRPDGYHIVPLSQHPITYSPNTSDYLAASKPVYQDLMYGNALDTSHR